MKRKGRESTSCVKTGVSVFEGIEAGEINS